MTNKSKTIFRKLKTEQPDLSLDDLLYKIYQSLDSKKTFYEVRNEIIEENNIDEYKYYTKNVNKILKSYIEAAVFPMYEKNDKAHGIFHIKEVIRRSFALNETLKLNLDPNMIFAIASCHDIGKYINHETHEKIAANYFIKDENMKNFFNDEERLMIKEAIEDHRSSKEDQPRSIYGQLISSADRNTRIEIVFIRSFFVAKERNPEMNIHEYLDYTFNRLSKRYGKENPENMFLEDKAYHIFLSDMRKLLQDEKKFKDFYCSINNITNRNNKVKDEAGETSYYCKKLIFK